MTVHASPSTVDGMRAIYVRHALFGLALSLALTGCGPVQADLSGSGHEGSTGEGSSTSEKQHVDDRQQITAGGVAAIVLDYLGFNAVRRFVTHESEPGSISVAVDLRAQGPHHFVIQVYSPDRAEVFSARKCEATRRGDSRCLKLENGTTISTIVDAEGFSDDNVDGMVVSASAITPAAGAVVAMYESYDDSPAVSAADLEAILADTRLTWLTDSRVNTAGKAIDVEESSR